MSAVDFRPCDLCHWPRDPMLATWAEVRAMKGSEITKDTRVAEIVKLCPGARRIFDEHGLKGCGGEHGPSEPLEFFAAVHQVDLQELLREMFQESNSTRPNFQIRPRRLSVAADLLRDDAVLPALWSSDTSGVCAYLHGISSARLYRGLYQHDDP